MSDSQLASFSADWLALREPADHTARNTLLTDSLLRWMAGQPARDILDLGTGTGSNLRYLCPQLGHEQRWTLIDHDASLLQALPVRLQAWCEARNYQFQCNADDAQIEARDFSAHLQWQQRDLAADLERLNLNKYTLVTASALLDLASRDWLERLARLCVEAHCASFFVLNYNGRVHWRPPSVGDIFITDCLNRHQGSDKGFGPAMGPDAAAIFAEILGQSQQVHTAPSDWQIAAVTDSQALLHAIASGWVSVASEAGPAASMRAERWWQNCKQRIDEGRVSLTVGHDDVLSLPLALVVRQRDNLGFSETDCARRERHSRRSDCVGLA